MSKIKDLIEYEPETGIFRWKAPGQGRRVGGIAGHAAPNGYNLIRINYILYKGGRLAWFLTHGVWPKEIDHINRNKGDDRLVNLREVTHSENGYNTATRVFHGERGVYWNKRGKKWEVKLRENFTNKHIGYFLSFEEAIKARDTYLNSAAKHS